MDPELRKLIEETRAIAKDNNDILRGIRHHQWLSLLTSVVFWILVLVLPLYLYQQYLQPILSKFYAASGISTTTGMFGLPTSAELQKLINSFKAGK